MTKPWRWFCLWFEAYARQSDTRCTYVCLHFLTFFYQWHVTVALQICVKAHVAVVFVDYSLSPEAKYPTAWEECFAVLVWLREHGREELKVDPDKIAVAGDSAGGRLTAALSSKPFIAAGVLVLRANTVYLLLPSDGQRASIWRRDQNADFDLSVHSRRPRAIRVIPSLRQWRLWAVQSSPCVFQQGSPSRSVQSGRRRVGLPDRCGRGGLPPALIFTAEADVLRDKGETYARKLAEAGVSATAMRVLGTGKCGPSDCLFR